MDYNALMQWVADSMAVLISDVNKKRAFSKDAARILKSYSKAKEALADLETSVEIYEDRYRDMGDALGGPWF